MTAPILLAAAARGGDVMSHIMALLKGVAFHEDQPADKDAGAPASVNLSINVDLSEDHLVHALDGRRVHVLVWTEE